MTQLRTLLVWAVLALVVLSFVTYLLGSPLWGAMLVVGIVIGATIAGNRTRPSTPSVRVVEVPAAPARPEVRETRRASTTDTEETDEGDLDFATDAKSVLGPAYLAQRERAALPVAAPTPVRPAGPSLLDRIEASRGSAPAWPWTKTLECTAHPECGPVTRVGHTGHGHGPSETTGLWCWHFDEWVLGSPDEEATNGSDLAARRADQAALNGGDPFVHKTYPTGP